MKRPTLSFYGTTRHYRYTPAQPVTLTWNTFTDAANEAGISRRYGGIHFEAGDLVGRAMGRLVADQAWGKAKRLWSGGKSEHKSEDESAPHEENSALVDDPDNLIQW